MSKQIIKKLVVLMLLFCFFLYIDYWLIGKVLFSAWLTAAPPISDDSYGTFWANVLSVVLVLSILLQIIIFVIILKKRKVKWGTNAGT